MAHTKPDSKLPGYETVTPNGVLTAAANHSSLTTHHSAKLQFIGAPNQGKTILRKV
jgi:hypothetical protein